MKLIKLSLLALLILLGANTQAKSKTVKALTQAEKLADFDSLYNTLKHVYPYFGVNKRKHGVDWLGNYESYREQIAETKNDKEFIERIQRIVYDLNSDHADLMPTSDYDYLNKLYRRFRILKKNLRSGYKHLKNKNARNKHAYWAQLLKEIREEKYGKEENLSENHFEQLKNDALKFEFDSIHKTAYIHIPSFIQERIRMDKSRLDSFFTHIENYDKLIIDIQGNSGGSDAYWIYYIVPYLLKETVRTEGIIAYKNDPVFINYEKLPSETYKYDEVKKVNMPEELKTENYRFIRTELKYPSYKIDNRFEGDVYLLVDKAVFSASESLAVFCKQTHLAKVVGKQTGGDGIGGNPFLFCLPNSGIIMRYTGEMGLNPDGSANVETCTIPDLELKGANAEERREELWKMLKEGEI